LQDARDKAKSILETAEYERGLAISSAKDWANDYLKEQREILKKDCQDVVDRRMTLAQLDGRKLLLQTKQKLIEEVFSVALDTLKKLPKKEYFALVMKNIEKQAETGDTIVLSRDGVLTEKDFSGQNIIKEKSLKISSERGDFDGGVLLSNKNCDKDLSFKSLLDERRESVILSITEKLFL
jgi:V/A-type H+-transporting ATPase subunit E